MGCDTSPGMLALLLGAAGLAVAAAIGIHGLLTGRAGRRLGWLFWPMLALVGFITELAYFQLLPLGLLRLPGTDKVVHGVLFGAMVFFLDQWLRGRDLRLGRLRLPLALLVILTAAGIEEAFQSLSPARSADLLDLLSDLAGMVLAAWLSRRVLRHQRGADG